MSWQYQVDQVCLELLAGGQRTRALDQVLVHIRAGERVALVGANGSGKSSLLRVLHGLLLPSVGRGAAQRGLAAGHAVSAPGAVALVGAEQFCAGRCGCRARRGG